VPNATLNSLLVAQPVKPLHFAFLKPLPQIYARTSYISSSRCLCSYINIMLTSFSAVSVQCCSTHLVQHAEQHAVQHAIQHSLHKAVQNAAVVQSHSNDAPCNKQDLKALYKTLQVKTVNFSPA